ncbi:polyketide cyclase [Streptomyces spiroverticillatus]|uniref:Polyketide cyclase n=1 Tax=Streptomyces finlayi TaxID=67296 RepID=A0A919CB75_9ACTN|nr:SRPBCC family protein [Streptomyces finlayi]GHA18535.1 polyketide cyclase [Streptomyces spiroverticillatus]GHD00074.1 polyketide cyclase [Streptomyces finlayi]
MVNVSRQFTVATPMPVIIEYLKDFSRTEEWDPGTKSCTRIGSGAVEVGARWRNVSVFRGKETELTYRLVDLAANRVVFVGENKSVTTSDDISLAPAPGGTEVTYRAVLDFKGPLKLVAPFLGREFERLADEVEKQLPRILEELPGAAG